MNFSEVSQAGFAGWLEVLLIALLLLWIYNSYRRSQLLRKIEEQVQNRDKSAAPIVEDKSKINTEKKGEYTDYEIVE